MAGPFDDLVPQQPQARTPGFIPGVPKERLPAPQTGAQAGLDQQQVINARLETELKNMQIAEERRKAAEAAAAGNKIAEQKATATGDMLRVITQLDRVAKDANDNSGWFETGTLGGMMRKFGPDGSPAYDLQRNLDLVGSNTAIDNLMQMRRESPTGGAVGNVSDKDLQLLKDKYGIFDPNQSHGEFMKNMALGKREFFKVLTRINPKAAASYLAQNPEGIWPTKDDKWFVGPRIRGAAAKPNSEIDGILKKYGM